MGGGEMHLPFALPMLLHYLPICHTYQRSCNIFIVCRYIIMVTYQRLILYKGSIVNSGADEMDKEISCRAKQLSGYINYCPRMVKNRMCADHGRNIVIHYNIWLQQQQPTVYPSFIFWLGGKRVTTTIVAIKREPVMIVRSLDKKGILLHLSFAYSFWAFSITFISFSPKSDYPFF